VECEITQTVKVNVFNPGNNALTASSTMAYPRWYPSITSLPNGDKLVLGGAISPGMGEPTPELYHPASGWRTLPGISIADEGGVEWYYPRSFVGFDGAVIVIQHDGEILRLTTGRRGNHGECGTGCGPGGGLVSFSDVCPFQGVDGAR
jgi:hypothetical protein